MHFRYIATLALALLFLVGCGSQRQAVQAIQAEVNPAYSTGLEADLQVSALDYRFVVNRSFAREGTVTIALKNDGRVPHDFVIRGEGLTERSQVIQSGRTTLLTVKLKQGTYRFVCEVGGHDTMGMVGSLVVSQ